MKTTSENKTVSGGRGLCGQCVSVVGITQEPSYLQQLVSQWKCILSWLYGLRLLKSLSLCVCAIHPPASYIQQFWNVAEKKAGWTVLCGRMFALWMTQDLGSWISSCGCCLPPLLSLDQDETELNSALFLLHLPYHTPTLDVGLPISITLSHSTVVFQVVEKTS